jgi:RNA polymerase sigma-70 factor (ECF subfamily)
LLCAYSQRFVNPEDAEEIVQDVLLWLWENREMHAITTSLLQYLFKAIYHRAVNLMLRNEAQNRIDMRFYAQMLEMLEDTDFYQIEELKEKIEIAINHLPASYREAFVMNRFRNLSYKEIATILNVSSKTVDYRIQQALKQLRHELRDYLPMLLLCLI